MNKKYKIGTKLNALKKGISEISPTIENSNNNTTPVSNKLLSMAHTTFK